MAPTGEVKLPRFAGRLRDGHDFVGVARVVCELGREVFGLAACSVMLHSASGQPILAVDDDADVPDEQRLAYLGDLWARDPYLRALREQHAPIGDAVVGQGGQPLRTLVLPILDNAGLLGSIRCARREPFTAELDRELMLLSAQVSVRLAHLGVTTVQEGPLSRLTTRQFEVAQLTALGWTNAEIARALDMSENTVKKHLKDVFARVDIDNRTELARLFVRVAPRDQFAIGVTHVGGLAITKAVAS